MSDITDEALRKLYVACTRNSGFPGKMLVGTGSNDDDVSTHAILQGLGLITTSTEDVSSYSSKTIHQDSEHTVWEMHHRSKSSPSSESPSTLQSVSFRNDTASLISCHPSNAMVPADCCATFREPLQGPHSLELTRLEECGGPSQQWVAGLPHADQLDHRTLGSSFLYEWDFQSMAGSVLP
jgi:hypothetical protein